MFYEKELTNNIIGAAIEVHRALGPRLLESVYQMYLAREFALRDLTFEKEKPLPVPYKGVKLDWVCFISVEQSRRVKRET